MPNPAAEILRRLQEKGTSALELLTTCEGSDQQPLWRQDSQLARAFTRKLIGEGHPTRAFEVARQGLAHHPDDRALKYLLALALACGGNLRGAESHLRELLQQPDLDAKLQVEALSLEGRLFKDRYERARDAGRRAELARKSAALYQQAASVAGANWFPRINFATMTLLAGNGQLAKELARGVLEEIEQELRQPDSREDYWRLATCAEACLLLGKLDEATVWYQQAVARAGADVGSIVSMRRNAQLLREKLEISDELMRLFYVGSVVVFSGHRLDPPERTAAAALPPRFPDDPALLRAVSAAIQEALGDLNATVGFCSAACGADILFAEHMLQRGAELHIVLPFARNDFYATSVDFNLPGMSHWRVRFDALLERATQADRDRVHYATTEAYLGDDVLFDFANRFAQGLGIIRAGQRGVLPQALVVLDPGASHRHGGTADFLDAWRQGNYPSRTIDLASLRQQVLGKEVPPAAAPPEARPAAPGTRMERQVKAMLFADVKDFSKLREEYSSRFFVRSLEEVAGVLQALQNAPVFSNTWGDGLYLVFDQVSDCAEAALCLLERAEQMNWKELEFAEATPLRIGVHAGPVFSGFDPIIGRKSYFGSHVNRAARIEPVTIPGCAYASEQFASLLAVERGHDFVAEYIGVEPLAKHYDRCPLYRLARR